MKRNRMQNKKQIRNLALATAMVGVLAFGGISAYFTDNASKTNEFTVGKISLNLTEPNWNPDDGTDITPNKEVAKDPKITNDGENTEYVFMTVDVPFADVVTAAPDGMRNESAGTELYSYTVNNGWTELGAPVNHGDYVTHTYVYGTAEACTELAKNAATPSLFDTIKFANVIEGQGLEGTNRDVEVKAFGIQSSDVNGGKTAPADVWQVLSNQINSEVKEN